MIFTNFREIDKLGRIVISKDIRKHLGIEPGDVLQINTEKNKKGTEYTYTVNGEVNAVYRIAVTNAYNAQFQNLVLTYE